jgi:hypothetical protein
VRCDLPVKGKDCGSSQQGRIQYSRKYRRIPMICCSMAQHLRLVLIALVAGCVDLTVPPKVTEADGPTIAPDAGPDARVPDGPETDAAPDDGPTVDVLGPDVVGPQPDGPPPPDTQPQPPDMAPPPDGPAPLSNGAACTIGTQCLSTVCSEGVCCDRACEQLCRSCKIAGSIGTCTMAAAGADPRVECPAQAASTCNRLGGCDGMGACRLHPQGTACATRCTGSTEAHDVCNGAGACVLSSTRACAPYLCGATTCATSCTGSGTGPCTAGNVCVGGSCVAAASAPVLYWNFDESSGTTAVDGSGSSRDGTYSGDTGTPQPSTSVPTLMFSNPRSRSFAIASRQGVRLGTMPSALRPLNNLTISVWYKSTRIDLDNGVPGSELVSGGDQYMLRLADSELLFVKRVSGGFERCYGTFSNPLDGQWHHVVALASSTAGMKVYVDGQERCSEALTASISYAAGDELWVGRHGNGDTDRDFDGQIDDVRIYNRVLNATEIADIAAGRR